MKTNINTLNIEYVETRKVSLRIKLVAFFLALIFVFVPMNEVFTQFKPVENIGWCCQPGYC
jgi:hypothetical protein